MKNLMTPDNIVSKLIETGDAGIVIRADGTPQIFNTYTPEQLAAPSALQIQTTRRLMALMVACQVPAVMEVLIDLSNSPDIVGDPGIQASLQ